jgi:hypothetical protein
MPHRTRHGSARSRPTSASGSAEAHDSLSHVTTFSDDAPPAAGPYLQTVSGRWVNPFDPDPGQLDAGDIARALANQCRFGGHSRVFYSVAQHCVIVSRVVEERGGDVEDVFAALMKPGAEVDPRQPAGLIVVRTPSVAPVAHSDRPTHEISPPLPTAEVLDAAIHDFGRVGWVETSRFPSSSSATHSVVELQVTAPKLLPWSTKLVFHGRPPANGWLAVSTRPELPWL